MKRRTLLAALALTPWLPAALAASPGEASRSGSLVTMFGAPPPAERVRRVFAAGAPAAVLVHALAPDKLLGWPMALSPEARALLGPAARDKPVLGRLAGRGSTVPMEALITLKPDIIIDSGTVDDIYRSGAERVSRLTGIPYALIDGRLSDSARQLREAAELLGVPEAGERLAAYADAALRACGNPDRSGGPRRVYYGRGADGLETGLAGSINTEVIELACGVNVASAAGRGGLARVSMEQLLAWAPDRIVTQDAGFHARARVDPLWRGLPAVRAGHFHLAPFLPFGWLDGPPSVNRLIGVRWLRAKLHGTDADVDWVDLAVEFHALFYGLAPPRRAIEQVLNPA